MDVVDDAAVVRDDAAVVREGDLRTAWDTTHLVVGKLNSKTWRTSWRTLSIDRSGDVWVNVRTDRYLGSAKLVLRRRDVRRD